MQVICAIFLGYQGLNRIEVKRSEWSEHTRAQNLGGGLLLEIVEILENLTKIFTYFIVSAELGWGREDGPIWAGGLCIYT